jgi:hypothetical protein
MFGSEFDHGRRTVAMSLLSPRDEGLLELAAERFPTIEAQVFRDAPVREKCRRATACAATGSRSEVAAIEISRAGIGWRENVFREPAGTVVSSPAGPVPSVGAQPAIRAHIHFLNAVSRPSVQRPRFRSGRPTEDRTM